MRPINIFTEPIEIVNISECNIEKTVNEHFQASITGYLRLEKEDESYFDHILEKQFIIKALTQENVEITLFRGMISDIEVDRKVGAAWISVHAQSNTAKLDVEHHIRTFQGTDQTYRQIIDAVIAGRKDIAMIQPRGKGLRTEGLVVQYEETDWQFLKRLASQLNTVLVSDCTNDHICFYFGNPEKRGEVVFDANEYKMKRYHDIKKGESVEYIMESRENGNLCEQIYVDGKPNYVYKIKCRIDSHELIYEYTLRPLSGFEVSESVNGKVAGISIMGTVTEVSDTHVRAKLLCESDYDFSNPIWYTFSTVYSSQDGTGWYCMPEKGDMVRLFIPSSKEQEAYAVSAVHLENNHDLRKNADEKCIRTKYGKEIRMTPDKILITNNRGIFIKIDDNEGIVIKSNQKIQMISENEIEISGEQVQLEGRNGVLLMEGPNMLMVRDGIKEQGMNIEHR